MTGIYLQGASSARGTHVQCSHEVWQQLLLLFQQRCRTGRPPIQVLSLARMIRLQTALRTNDCPVDSTAGTPDSGLWQQSYKTSWGISQPRMTNSYPYIDPLSEHAHVCDRTYTFGEIVQGMEK